MEKPLVNKKFRLEKIPGKGGWTFLKIDGIRNVKSKAFGMVKVQGSIDDYPLKGFTLWATKKGGHFMPVKAEIRKKIGKKEGDWVKVVLYSDNDPFTIPDEIVRCLEDDPATFKAFQKLGEGQQKAWINWITSAKGSETRVNRIVEMMEKVSAGQKFGEEK